MHRRVVSCVLAASILGACSSGGGEPTALECQVLSWADPVTVSFPLEATETIEESVDVEGLLVEFRYRYPSLRWSSINNSAGERDYIATDEILVPSAMADVESVGEVIADSTHEHPTNRQQFRVRCTSA